MSGWPQEQDHCPAVKHLPHKLWGSKLLHRAVRAGSHTTVPGVGPVLCTGEDSYYCYYTSLYGKINVTQHFMIPVSSPYALLAM